VALALLGRDYEIRHEGGAVYLQYQSLRLSLPAGPLPVKSLAAAAVAVHRLEPELPPSTLESVLARVRVAGRFERLGEAPPVYVDVGHNPHAAGWLAGRVRDLPGPPRKVIAVYAALADKDVEGVALRMAPVVSEWHLAPLAVPRGLTLADLSARLAAAGVTGRGHDSVADALAAAKAAAGEDGVVVVFGSFFTVAEARAVLVSGVP
jgi:dihydrofolate synthase/folylpolyglutamate synthase